ncbi:MAG: M28 family peptidase [Alphaproteobacteria bacterium]|nr:M28 family peptidase [Alphaproteobacteria bacterium]
MGHCEEFAKRVKLSGSTEEKESFRYLEKCMKDYGFRTALIEHDAYISLPGAARVEADGKTLKSITHSFSRPAPGGGLTASLIDLGDGAAQDFARAECRGKIVLVNGIASPAIAARASAAGAAGQLHVSPHEHLHEMCISPVWGSPSGDTLDEMPTTVACTISDADGAALRRALAKSPALKVTLHAEVDTGWRKTPLLVCDIDGPKGADAPFVLLSGHHDTWYFGVMDNGSANATMMEAARLLAAQVKTWRRGLRVCFWSGHSHGRYSGSAWYVDHHWADLEKRCVAHVNVDSTGGIGATLMGDNGVVSSLAELASTVTRAETGQNHEGKRPSRSSDQSFWGIGIPSMYGSVSHQPPGGVKMRNALGWWWHTPHDLIDKVDREFLVRDTRVVLHTLWRLLTDKVLPIDPAAQLASLRSELTAIAKSKPAPAVTALIAAVDGATEATARLKAAHPADDAACEAINAALLAMSRALMPLDYTEGDRFRHDAALPQPAWPVLQGLRELAAAAPDSDQAKFRAVSAARAGNRLLHALEQVSRAASMAL